MRSVTSTGAGHLACIPLAKFSEWNEPANICAIKTGGDSHQGVHRQVSVFGVFGSRDNALC